MMKKWGLTPYIIVFLSMLTVVFGFTFYQKNHGVNVAGQIIKSLGWEKQDVDPQSAKKIAEVPTPTPIVLSDSEKIGQILAVPVVLGGGSTGLLGGSSTNLVGGESLVSSGSGNSTMSAGAEPQFWNTLEEIRPGIIVIFGKEISLDEVQAFHTKLRERTRNWPIQPLVAVDHEGGGVQRLSGSGFTKLPSWREVCQLEDSERFDLLEKVASELESAGVNLIFGPVVDLYNENSNIGDRACDSDPDQVTIHALDAINIFSRHHIASVIKHYPGLGQGKLDTHHKFEVVDLTLDDLVPFRQILVQKPSTGVMAAHVGIKDLYDQPCTLSEPCISSLRDAYPGTVIFSDALDMSAVYGGETDLIAGDLAGASEKAVEAGVDILVLGKNADLEKITKVQQALLKKYIISGDFSTLVDESLTRLVKYRAMLNS